MPSFVSVLLSMAVISARSPQAEASQQFLQGMLADIIPPVSASCNDQSGFNHQPVPDSWHERFTAGEQLNFVTQMNHDDPDPCKSWKMRIGSGGNIYSLKGCFGETVPDLVNHDALWVDAVIQSISVNTDLNDNDNQNYWFLHQAGVYQKADDITTNDPFFSPSVASHCDDTSCFFTGWGQHAWIPTNFTSDVLYFNRYTDCGNGVMEVAQVIHNAGDPSSDQSVPFDRFNIPWGGFKTSVFQDLLIPDKENNLQLQYPLQTFGVGDKTQAVSNTNGYAVFAEDISLPATNLVKPFEMPCDDISCVELVVDEDDTCIQSTSHTQRYVVKCTIEPTAEVDSGCEGCNLYFTNRETGQGVEVPHVAHWSVSGNQLYFHAEDLSGIEPRVLTAEDMNNMFSKDDIIDVSYSIAFRMPCAVNGRTAPCPADETAHDDQVVKLKVDRDNGCRVSGYHSDGQDTVVRMMVYNTVSNKSGCDQCFLKFIKQSDPTKWISVKDVLHWSFDGRYLFFTPFNSPFYADSSDPAVNAICDEIDQVFSKDDTIIVQNYDPGKPIEENNGISHVFGGSSGILRYGKTSSGKDFTVYSLIKSGTVHPGDSIVSRQYYLIGNLDSIEQRSLLWTDDAFLDIYHNGDMHPTQIDLVSSSGGNSFGVTLDSASCDGAVPICTGSTTPQPDLIAHFFIQCGGLSYMGPDKYFFATQTEAIRPYECEGQPGNRPEWKLIGYYPKNECASLQDAMFDETLCSGNDETQTKTLTNSPTKSPTKAPTTNPTASPTKLPTKGPTSSPTKLPTESPTSSPTKSPTKSPTESPTNLPTKGPTASPTSSPTKSPTKSPTESPTKSPTKGPTASPTSSPTKSPTKSPTESPTNLPTKGPTASPTSSPTKSPTKGPTASPTKSPTKSPTASPTKSPTKGPTASPTKLPTKNPTASPTKLSTVNPTKAPTTSVTASPTKAPTTSVTASPTKGSTKNPTATPIESLARDSSNTKSPTTSPATELKPNKAVCLNDDECIGYCSRWKSQNKRMCLPLKEDGKSCTENVMCESKHCSTGRESRKCFTPETENVAAEEENAETPVTEESSAKQATEESATELKPNKAVCLSDDECIGYCSSWKVKNKRQCLPLKNDGKKCSKKEQCKSGFCSEGGKCSTPETDNVAEEEETKLKPNKAVCLSDDECIGYCSSWKVKNERQCLPLKKDGKKCSKKEQCKSGFCSEGRKCSTPETENVAAEEEKAEPRPKQEQGAVCTEHDDCIGYCSSWKVRNKRFCIPLKKDGKKCSGEEQCQSGYCSTVCSAPPY